MHFNLVWHLIQTGAVFEQLDFHSDLPIWSNCHHINAMKNMSERAITHQDEEVNGANRIQLIFTLPGE